MFRIRRVAAIIPRRRTPSFAIVSLPRSGSTALYRVLNSDPRVRIAYEPDFSHARHDSGKLGPAVARLKTRVNGIKHVWDPNGWPFANPDHHSTLSALKDAKRWVEHNAALLKQVDKVVFLKRRNQLARVISDLLGQQTGNWGHDPAAPSSIGEADEYRRDLQQRTLSPLNEDIIGWYLENASEWEARILERVPESRTRKVYYLDLFGSDVPLDERITRVREISEWLGVKLPNKCRSVREVLQPKAKLNDDRTYRQVPNFERIVARFGSL